MKGQIKKSHGPALRAAQLDLARCPICIGKAVVKGVFHDLACVQCKASGWVSAETGEALPLDVLVTQLSLRLQSAQHQITEMQKLVQLGVELAESVQYEKNNRRGAGGSNYTGD